MLMMTMIMNYDKFKVFLSKWREFHAAWIFKVSFPHLGQSYSIESMWQNVTNFPVKITSFP